VTSADPIGRASPNLEVGDRPSVERLSWPLSLRHCEEWDRLCKKSRADPLFLSREWLVPWVKHFCRMADAEVFVLACRNSDDRLVGMFAFVKWVPTSMVGWIRRRRLQMLGNLYRGPVTMRSEYMDFPVEPDYLNRCATAIASYLLDMDCWDDFIIQDVRCESDAARLLVNELSDLTYVRQIGDSRFDVAGSVSVDEPFNDYVSSLGQGTRRRLFGSRRRLERLGDVSIDRVGVDGVERGLQQLNELHSRRWGVPAFDGRRLAFHVELATLKAQQGLLKLSRLRFRGDVVSIMYNVVAGDVEYNLQLGFDDSAVPGVTSLGYLHIGYSIEQAFADPSIRTYDFLAGMGRSEAFKHRFCNKLSRLHSFQIVRTPALRVLYAAHDRLRRRRVGPDLRGD